MQDEHSISQRGNEVVARLEASHAWLNAAYCWLEEAERTLRFQQTWELIELRDLVRCLIREVRQDMRPAAKKRTTSVRMDLDNAGPMPIDDYLALSFDNYCETEQLQESWLPF
jgi:hypothetical protein